MLTVRMRRYLCIVHSRFLLGEEGPDELCSPVKTGEITQ